MKTVGSQESLLRILHEFQGVNGHRVLPAKLWNALAASADGRDGFCLYSEQEDRSSEPPGAYLCDLAALDALRYTERLDSGEIELTPSGRATVRYLALPPELATIPQLLESGE